MPYPCTFRRWSISVLLIFLAGSALGTTKATADALTTVPGGVLTIPLPETVRKATYQGRPVWLRDGRAIVGVSVKAKLGPHELKLTYEDDRSELLPFTVEHKAYREQHLELKDRKMVNPDPEQLKRIRSEAASMRAVYRSFSSREPPSSFVQPLTGIVTSEFGFRRVLNGQPRNPHSGLDLAAPRGTPILNPADGTVALTGNFYFNGNTVLVDHGQGLISMVCHLDSIAVSDGDEITQGTPLGTVGSTGRSTGPHLHWSVSLNGHRVDPRTALEQFGTPLIEPDVSTATSR